MHSKGWLCCLLLTGMLIGLFGATCTPTIVLPAVETDNSNGDSTNDLNNRA